MIGKKHILTAVKAKLIPGNIWGNEPNGHLQWFNRQDSLEHFNRCTPGKNGVPWKHLYFSFSFPVVSIYSSVRDHIQYLIFRTLAWTLPTTAVLDKISKQLVLEGRKKGWIKSSWAKLSYSTGLCPCPDNATISCCFCSKWVKYMAPTIWWNILFNRQDYHLSKYKEWDIYFSFFLSSKHFLMISGLKK